MPTPEAYEYLVSIARELNIPLDPEDQNVPQPGDLHGARQDLLAARKARESVIAAPRGRMRFLKYLLLRLLQVYTRAFTSPVNMGCSKEMPTKL